jgi:hypothetical protein
VAGASIWRGSAMAKAKDYRKRAADAFGVVVKGFVNRG